jgi:hypothetical protein
MPPTTPTISGMIFLHPPWRPSKEIVSAICRIFFLDPLNLEIFIFVSAVNIFSFGKNE